MDYHKLLNRVGDNIAMISQEGFDRITSHDPARIEPLIGATEQVLRDLHELRLLATSEEAARPVDVREDEATAQGRLHLAEAEAAATARRLHA